jgi:hypothetical protein
MRDAPTVKPKVKTSPIKTLAKGPKAYVKAIHSGDANPMGLSLAAPAIKDAAELAVTTPSSIAKVATTAVTHPKKLPGMLAAPYVQAIKDPKKAITEHPVSTALMFAPAVKMPGRAVGKAARAAGKQTLERPAATLPGPPYRRSASAVRDASVRAVQSHEDKKNPSPEMTVKDVHRRVDEAYDAARLHRNHAKNAAARQVKERKLTGDAAAEHVKGAAAGANDTIAKRFGEEFGSTLQVTPQGHVVKPRGAVTGTLHDTRDQASKVVARLNAKPAMVRTGHGEERRRWSSLSVPLETSSWRCRARSRSASTSPAGPGRRRLTSRSARAVRSARRFCAGRGTRSRRPCCPLPEVARRSGD